MIGIEDIIYIKNEMHKVPGGGSIIVINDTYSLYEDEPVTVSVGTYSKSAVIDDGSATIKGFTETGTVTVSVSDFTTTFNIDKYSKYEVGVGSVGGFYASWLQSINESAAGYHSLADVLADEKMVRELFTRHASVNFLVSNVGSYPEELETIIFNDYCAKWINLRDYALDTLYANQLVASLMDQADKYFYGEWTIVDSTTTPPTWGPKGNVPVMTSNTAPYGEASAYVSNNNRPAYCAFDNDPFTWVSPPTQQATGSVQYKFTNPVCVREVMVKAYYDSSTQEADCKDFTISGSNDGTNFSTIYTGQYQKNDNAQRFKFANNAFYLYYKLDILTSWSTLWRIHSLQFYGRELRISVPKMTSDTAPYGQVIYNSQYNTGSLKAYNVFNESAGTGWMPSTNSTNNYVGYKFVNPKCVKLVTFKLIKNLNPSTNSITAKLQGSNTANSDDWSDLYTFQSTSSTKAYLDSITNNNTYSYYRIFIASSMVKDDANYWYIDYLDFYGLDYSEYDWDADNPRHYIYDHGIELEDLTLIGSVSKDSDCLKLIAANDQASKILDTTDYTLLRGVVGANASGTNVLLCGSGSATFTGDYMPYNQSLDVSSINSTNATGVKQTAAGTFDAAELWLE